jgi:predicted Zn-dependent protease
VWHYPSGDPGTKNAQLVEAQVKIGAGFSTSDRRAIVEGLNMWEYSTRGAFRWILVDQLSEDDMKVERVEFILVTSLEPRVKEYDKDGLLLGLAISDRFEPTQLWLVIDRLYSSEDVKMVSAHEFGHALGIGHVSTGVNVMSPRYAGSTCLTEEDMSAFCDVYGCSVQQMVYCTRE